eukprot:357204-Chlamydomonas_euryale.AAC.3
MTQDRPMTTMTRDRPMTTMTRDRPMTTMTGRDRPMLGTPVATERMCSSRASCAQPLASNQRVRHGECAKRFRAEGVSDLNHPPLKLLFNYILTANALNGVTLVIDRVTPNSDSPQFI